MFYWAGELAIIFLSHLAGLFETGQNSSTLDLEMQNLLTRLIQHPATSPGPSRVIEGRRRHNRGRGTTSCFTLTHTRHNRGEAEATRACAFLAVVLRRLLLLLGLLRLC